MRFSMDTRYEIWNDDHGDVIKVGPDGDGLGLVELRETASDGKETVRLTMSVEQALLVAEAIKRAVDDARAKGG